MHGQAALLDQTMAKPTNGAVAVPVSELLLDTIASGAAA
jgi:hypothetical protein